MIAGHGPNIGHGFNKYVVIDQDGTELQPIIFPSVIARAGTHVSGALTRVTEISVGNERWWVGEDALLSPNSLTLLAQERLHDTTFIPALLRCTLKRLGLRNGSATSYCVTGLPATWAADPAKARLLGERLRSATSIYTGIRVIPEPLGLIYAMLLDNNGQIAGDDALSNGRVAVVDLGHHTVDVAVIQRLTPVPSSLNTFTLGTAQPLRMIRARLSAAFERELTLYETDQAVRTGALSVAGQLRSLPNNWDQPLHENGEAVATRLVEEWGRGTQFDIILIGGGGAEEDRLVQAIKQRFAHAVTVERPQAAIARGYAKLARRLGKGRP
jgi:hypothetical protein